jgi:hypothetical protein
LGKTPLELVPIALISNETDAPAAGTWIYVPRYPSLLSVHAAPLAAPLDFIIKLFAFSTVCARTPVAVPAAITNARILQNRFLRTLTALQIEQLEQYQR